jgi:hypothetical protein
VLVHDDEVVESFVLQLDDEILSDETGPAEENDFLCFIERVHAARHL